MATKGSKVVDRPDLDIHDYVEVKNGHVGKLVYVSKKTGEEIVWESYGDVQELELVELKSARASAKAFFARNYFILDDDVITWLNVGAYYKNYLDDEGIIKLSKRPGAEILKYVNSLTEDQKQTFIPRIYRLWDSKEIDSIRAIEAFSKGLGVNFNEE